MLSRTQKLAALALIKEVDHLDAMHFSRKFNEANFGRSYDERYLDHHEFSSFLDELHRKGIVEYDNSKRSYDRFTVYKVTSFANSNPVRLFLEKSARNPQS